MRNSDKDDKSNPKNIKIWTNSINRTQSSVVNRAIDLVIAYKPNFFYGVEEIVVDPPSHDGINSSTTKGYVTNKKDPTKGDLSKVIYIFVDSNKEEAKNRLKNESNLDEAKRSSLLNEATSVVIADTMVHEKEHVEDKLEHGEAPAEQKQREFEPKFKQLWNDMLKKSANLSIEKLVRLAVWFEKISI